MQQDAHLSSSGYVLNKRLSTHPSAQIDQDATSREAQVLPQSKPFHTGLLKLEVFWFLLSFLSLFISYSFQILHWTKVCLIYSCLTFLSLWQNTMAKILIREIVYLGITVSEHYSPWPSQQGAQQQAGRHGARAEAVAEGLHLNHNHDVETKSTGNCTSLLNLRSSPWRHISSNETLFPNFPKSWGPSIQIHELMGHFPANHNCPD